MELSRLCEMQGISGREELVRMAIFRECAEVLGEENVKIDRTGNVIAHKACRKADAPRVMVAAHMDEVGLMVINAADDGLLQVRNIGGVDPRVLVSKRVKVGYDVPARDGKPAQEALNGVIGAMAIHLQSAADRKNVLPIENLYVDIGAKDKDEALAKAPEGTPVTFATSSAPIGDGCLLCKAGDDRVGCYNLLRLLHADVTCDTWFAFTCQEEVGSRGAYGAAFRIQPDVALILEGTTANDAGEHEALVSWLGKSCMLGNETSCMRTATLDRSDDRVRWVEEACRLGRMDACLDAAERRQNGNGVPVDMKLALQNYQAACRLSNAPSCFRAAKILRSGDGVKADPKAAAVWYDKACQMRQTRACAILGDLYLSGEGVDKDDVRARFYHNIACSSGLRSSCPKAGR